jgi:hypothetical protein
MSNAMTPKKVRIAGSLYDWEGRSLVIGEVVHIGEISGRLRYFYEDEKGNTVAWLDKIK